MAPRPAARQPSVRTHRLWCCGAEAEGVGRGARNRGRPWTIGEIYRLGLSTPAGYGGRLLTPAQRAGVALARALVTRPQVLVIDDALASFGAVERAAATARLVQQSKGRTLVMVVRDAGLLKHFDTRIEWDGSTLTSVDDDASEGAAAVAGAAG